MSSERADFIVGYASEAPMAPLHAVIAILREKQIHECGATKLECEHKGVAVCGRKIIDVAPRFEFEVAMIDQTDEFEDAKWNICRPCREFYENNRAIEAAARLRKHEPQSASVAAT